MIKPTNYQCWTIGKRLRNGHFKVRRVVWGLTLARLERRADEEIRAAEIEVERDWKPRHPKPTKPRPPLVSEMGWNISAPTDDARVRHARLTP